MESETADPARRRLIDCAAACLDHIRAVQWGTATSQYRTTDRGFDLHVRIEISCFSAQKKE
jgi:hypothetical protein